MDGPDDNLPQGEERSEQFVLEVSEYFERLDVCKIPNCQIIFPASQFPHSPFKLQSGLHWHI